MKENNFEVQKSRTEPGKSVEDMKNVEGVLDEAFDKMLEQYKEMGKSLSEIIPRSRNFDIELQESEDGARLCLKHKENGAEQDLRTYLPPGHFFEEGEVFAYEGKEKKVCFPKNELEFRGFLLALFHEIGHSWEKREHATTRWDNIRAAGSILKKWMKYMAKAVKLERKQSGLGIKFIDIVKDLDPDSLLPGWYLDKKAKSDAQSERNAWAYALRSLRSLAQEGYDVFAGYDNAAQIRDYVGHCLYSYDLNLLMNKLMSGDAQDLQKLKEAPAFWKKSKKHIKIVL